ncbi:hypothetical protein OUZ56_008634 [Daphnia magna]|uniref:Uncharacterized protein n=1 Tax=Daphnia magna TaxID=35525 RepID=A0ABR0ADK7_9CRUS|nr:hypothetical protein OUZ56_008634 [Daphnia magna]
MIYIKEAECIQMHAPLRQLASSANGTRSSASPTGRRPCPFIIYSLVHGPHMCARYVDSRTHRSK